MTQTENVMTTPETTETLDSNTRALLAAALAAAVIKPDEPQVVRARQLWASGDLGSSARDKAIEILKRRYERYEALLEALDEDFGVPEWTDRPEQGRRLWESPEMLLHIAGQIVGVHARAMRRVRAKPGDTWARLSDHQRELMTKFGMAPEEAGLAYDFVVDVVGGFDALVRFYAGRSKEEVDARIRQLQQPDHSAAA
jgi:hypothetical protein